MNKIGCSINTEEVIKKFGEIDYKELTDVFKDAIAKSIEILKSATENEIRSGGVHVNGPIRKGGINHTPMSKGVIAEVAVDGTAGRVRIAPASRKGYDYGGEGSFALKWYEYGTQERFRKTKSGKASTGKLKSYNWFGNAFNSTSSQVNQALEDNITKAIQSIWNR